MINILQTKSFLLSDFFLFIWNNKQFELKIKLLVLISLLIILKNGFILTIYLRKRFVMYFIIKKK